MILQLARGALRSNKPPWFRMLPVTNRNMCSIWVCEGCHLVPFRGRLVRFRCDQKSASVCHRLPLCGLPWPRLGNRVAGLGYLRKIACRRSTRVPELSKRRWNVAWSNSNSRVQDVAIAAACHASSWSPSLHTSIRAGGGVGGGGGGGCEGRQPGGRG